MSLVNSIDTLLQVTKHAIKRHPELAPHLEDLILQSQGKSSPANLEVAIRLLCGGSDEILKCVNKSKSQYAQDIFVQTHLDYKSHGYFVEFGATNGVTYSNTYLMEKFFGWKGILAEPGLCWQSDLYKNRECNIENKCVWKDSGKVLTFNESWEVSTIDEFSYSDHHAALRRNGKRYQVETISLNDLLDKYKAPTAIDYLSIDTEGSEYEILSAFDFDRYKFSVITCEHNYTTSREKICDLLTAQGYKRVHQDLSQGDDWYIL